MNVSQGPTLYGFYPLWLKLKLQQEFREDIASAVEYAYNNKALVMFAAGNEKIDNDDELFPSSMKNKKYYEERWLSNAMTVTAAESLGGNSLDLDRTFGDVVDIAAPSSDISFADTNGNVSADDGMSSAATALLTGSAALVWSLDPTLSPIKVKNILIETGNDTDNGTTNDGTNIPTLNLYGAVSHEDLGTTNSLDMTFNLIPAGTFIMGSPEDELGRATYMDQEAQHEVTLTKDFYMQTTEVTQGQWEAVMGSYYSPWFQDCGSDCPVDYVSWIEVRSFISTLNAMGENTYRLPTEAEWEYAARAGSTTAIPNGNITVTECEFDANLGAIAWYCYHSPTQLRLYPVAQKDANDWGLYDMHGNVLEWVQDWFEYEYPAGPVIDPRGPAESTGNRVIRGGHAHGPAFGCRSAERGASAPDDKPLYMGFRLVKID